MKGIKKLFNIYPSLTRIVVLRPCILVIVLGIVIQCKSESLPEGVPEGAIYNRKTNIYQIESNGKQLKYFKDGSLYESCEVNNLSILDGYCESFLDSSGIKVKSGRFKNGQRDGLWVWNFEDGSIYIRQNFTYGKKRSFWIPVEEWGNEDGIYERFFPGGGLEEKGYFNSGYRSGDWIKYYPSGRKEYIGSYEKGKRINNWIHYYPNGRIEALEIFTDKGELLERTTFYPNGERLCLVKPNIEPDCKVD